MTKVTIRGRPVLKVWESIHGWYWFATEKVDEHTWFGLVRGFVTEWGSWDERELKANAPWIWEVERKNWGFCPLVEKEVSPCDSEDASRPMARTETSPGASSARKRSGTC